MPRYAVIADLPKYAAGTVAFESISDVDKLAALDAASALADGYIAGQRALPLISWGLDLTRAVCILAARDLLATRGYNPQAGNDEEVQRRAAEVTRWFEQIALGAVQLQAVDSAPGPDGHAEAPQVITETARGWNRRGSSSTGGDGWGE